MPHGRATHRAIPLAALALLLALTAGGCGPGDGAGRGDADAAADPAESVDTAPGDAGAAGASAAVADTAPTRVALPSLFSIMLGLQRDAERVGRGLWVEGYDSIAAAAQSIADHPAIPPEEGRQIAGVLGDDMGRFQEMDRTVHDLAVRLAERARAGDLEAVLATDARLRRGCVECHTEFRARLREGIR